MNRKVLLGIFAFMVIAVAATASYPWHSRTGRGRLTVATTTSLYDTGLLDEIEVNFEEKHPIDLCFIPVGTGLAFEHARRGDADLTLTHDPSREFSFLADGYGLCRKAIAYNFFMIVGPAEDPAGVEDLAPTHALAEIVEAGRRGVCKWVSRGDGSGTHMKEKELWSRAGFNWESLRIESWYFEAGAGMGETLQIAEERSAYTLSDSGTYLKYHGEGIISLKALISRGGELLNVYSVIAVNPSLHTEVNFEEAITFIKFLVSEEGQKMIDQYGRDIYGESLFHPAAKLLRGEGDESTIRWIEEEALFNGMECPKEYWDNHPELYE
ncbi:MAG: substrate-binding domain-containing protein [Candidatus Bathyarchaeia archaeon]